MKGDEIRSGDNVSIFIHTHCTHIIIAVNIQLPELDRLHRERGAIGLDEVIFRDCVHRHVWLRSFKLHRCRNQAGNDLFLMRGNHYFSRRRQNVIDTDLYGPGDQCVISLLLPAST